MSTDHRMDAAVQDHGGLREAFASEARRKNHQAADTSLTATAKAEIAASERAETALDQHDRNWDRQRDALAGKPEDAPTLDYGVQPARSIEAEYKEARTRWEMRQGQIIQEHQVERADIRGRGQTLSDAFQDSVAEANNRPGVMLSDAFNMDRDFVAEHPAAERPAPRDIDNAAGAETPQKQAAPDQSLVPRQRSTGRSL